MANDKNAAQTSLKRFMQCMGQMHATSYNHINNYKDILQKLNPIADNWQDDFKEMFSKIVVLLERFNIPFTSNLKREISHVFNTAKNPGSFTTLMHGDFSPTNVFDDPKNNRMRIFDFEWSFLGSALLDGVALRMSNPTCWCVKSFPKDTIDSLEEIYRQELIRYIPEASDDKLYYDAYVSACAYWMLWRVISIDEILYQDYDVSNPKFYNLHPNWNPEDNLRRPRTIYRLQAFIDVSQTHDILPYLRSMAEQILMVLKYRWPNTEPLNLFPAFLSE